LWYFYGQSNTKTNFSSSTPILPGTYHFTIAIYPYFFHITTNKYICTLLYCVCIYVIPLTLQPAVGFGLSKNTSSFFPISHQHSPSSHSQHLKIFFYFFSPYFLGPFSSSCPFQFLSENLSAHPILLQSLQVTQPTYSLPLYPFYYILSFTQLF